MSGSPRPGAQRNGFCEIRATVYKKRAITHFHEHGSLLRYWNIFRSGMGVRCTNGKPRLILTSFVLALSSISPFTPKYEL